MTKGGPTPPSPSVIDRRGLQSLIETLRAHRYEVIAPTSIDGAIGLGSIEYLDDLPDGWRDCQDAGTYRLERRAGTGLFDHSAPVHSWKRYLYPPVELLFRARRDDGGMVIETGAEEEMRHAFLGIRACDLHALQVVDRVLANGRNADPRYAARRERTFIVAVDCTRAGGSCFCASMGTGPAVNDGYDLKLGARAGDDGDNWLVFVGSEAGSHLLEMIDRRPALPEEVASARAAVDSAATAQTRSMVPDVADLLRRNLEHRAWERIAARCLGCANCTLVCPTCFCATVEDATDLSGRVAERWRKVDSCFTNDFSYIHGGSIRRGTAARYRQWMTHKLSSWWEQFGVSGCVGCGRCITWCPVGIDITAEARLLQADDRGEAA